MSQIGTVPKYQYLSITGTVFFYLQTYRRGLPNWYCRSTFPILITTGTGTGYQTKKVELEGVGLGAACLRRGSSAEGWLVRRRGWIWNHRAGSEPQCPCLGWPMCLEKNTT